MSKGAATGAQTSSSSDEVPHLVQLRVSGLTGIVTTGSSSNSGKGSKKGLQQQQQQTEQKNTDEDVKAVVAVMRDSVSYGTCGPSKSLVQSAADKNTYIAVWNKNHHQYKNKKNSKKKDGHDEDLEKKEDAPILFEANLAVSNDNSGKDTTAATSNKRLHHRNYELIVGLTASTSSLKDNGTSASEASSNNRTVVIGAASLPLQDAARLANSQGKVVLDLPVFNVKSLNSDPFASMNNKGNGNSNSEIGVEVSNNLSRSSSLRRKLSLHRRRDSSSNESSPLMRYSLDKTRDAAIVRVELTIRKKEATNKKKKSNRAVLVHSQQHAIETAHTVSRSKSNDVVNNILYMEPSIEQVLSNCDSSSSPEGTSSKRKKKKKPPEVAKAPPPPVHKFRVKIVDQTTQDYVMTPSTPPSSLSSPSLPIPTRRRKGTSTDNVQVLDSAIERVLSMSDDDEEDREAITKTNKEAKAVATLPPQKATVATQSQKASQSNVNPVTAVESKKQSSLVSPSSATKSSANASLKTKSSATATTIQATNVNQKKTAAGPATPQTKSEASPLATPQQPRPPAKTLSSTKKAESARHPPQRGRRSPGPFAMMRLRDKAKSEGNVATSKQPLKQAVSPPGKITPASTPTTKSKAGKLKGKDIRKTAKESQPVEQAPPVKAPRRKSLESKAFKSSPQPNGERQTATGVELPPPPPPPSPPRTSPAVGDGKRLGRNTPPVGRKSPRPILKTPDSATNKRALIPPTATPPRPADSGTPGTSATSPVAIMIENVQSKDPISDWKLEGVVKYEPEKNAKSQETQTKNPTAKPQTAGSPSTTSPPNKSSGSNAHVEKNKVTVDENKVAQNGGGVDDRRSDPDEKHVFGLVQPCGELEDILDNTEEEDSSVQSGTTRPATMQDNLTDLLMNGLCRARSCQMTDDGVYEEGDSLVYSRINRQTKFNLQEGKLPWVDKLGAAVVKQLGDDFDDLESFGQSLSMAESTLSPGAIDEASTSSSTNQDTEFSDEEEDSLLTSSGDIPVGPFDEVEEVEQGKEVDVNEAKQTLSALEKTIEVAASGPSLETPTKLDTKRPGKSPSIGSYGIFSGRTNSKEKDRSTQSSDHSKRKSVSESESNELSVMSSVEFGNLQKLVQGKSPEGSPARKNAKTAMATKVNADSARYDDSYLKSLPTPGGNISRDKEEVTKGQFRLPDNIAVDDPSPRNVMNPPQPNRTHEISSKSLAKSLADIVARAITPIQTESTPQQTQPTEPKPAIKGVPSTLETQEIDSVGELTATTHEILVDIEEYKRQINNRFGSKRSNGQRNSRVHEDRNYFSEYDASSILRPDGHAAEEAALAKRQAGNSRYV